MHQPTPLFALPTLVVILLLTGLIGLGMLGWRRRRKGTRSEYQATPLLSPAEVEIYRCLTGIYGSSVLICPKVRLLDLVRPRKEMDRSKFQIAFNRVSSKHVDFVVLRSEDFAVLGVVELDDRSHARQDRMDRDGFVDDALRQGGIPVCRVKARSQYDLDALCRQLNEAFAPPVSAPAGA